MRLYDQIFYQLFDDEDFVSKGTCKDSSPTIYKSGSPAHPYEPYILFDAGDNEYCNLVHVLPVWLEEDLDKLFFMLLLEHLLILYDEWYETPLMLRICLVRHPTFFNVQRSSPFRGFTNTFSRTNKARRIRNSGLPSIFF